MFMPLGLSTIKRTNTFSFGLFSTRNHIIVILKEGESTKTDMVADLLKRKN